MRVPDLAQRAIVPAQLNSMSSGWATIAMALEGTYTLAIHMLLLNNVHDFKLLNAMHFNTNFVYLLAT
jgi:hypothetical protein